jgi:hypothetical protein
MQLLEDWDRVLKRAWSIKFTAISIVLSAGEVVVQIWQPAHIPNGLFAGLAGAVSVGAGIARLLAQQEESNADPAPK